MKHGISYSLITIVAIVVVIIIVGGGFYYTQSQPRTEKPNLQTELRVSEHVHFLYVDKDNPNLMLMGTHESLFRSSDMEAKLGEL